MLRRALTLALFAACAASCDPSVSPREARVRSTLVRADQSWLRARPSLTRAKFEAMRLRLYDYYRGSYPVFVRDAIEGDPRAALTRFAPGALVAGIGDAHPENVGVLVASDGSLGLEFNDFDAADRVPYVWDLRRLCAGLALAAEVSNEADPDAQRVTAAAARSIASAAAEGYLAELRRLHAGGPAARIADGQGAPNLEDLFRRGARDLSQRRELAELTEVRDGATALRRGALDPAEPTATLGALPEVAREAIPALLERYRRTLSDPRDAQYFTVLDAARQFGSGIASLPRVRVLVLVRGPTDAPDDDVVLEIKELGDSGATGTVTPFVWADSVAQRVRTSAWTAWGDRTREPLFGTDEWLGVPVQVRAEREAHKTLRTSRMTAALGTPDALARTARVLGTLLARVHFATDDGRATVAAILRAADVFGDDAFRDEHADASLAYAAQVREDWSLFREAITREGPLLGFTPDPEDRASTDVRALLFSSEEPTR
jgi:uncharacterized protein (DUF2252 family)